MKRVKQMELQEQMAVDVVGYLERQGGDLTVGDVSRYLLDGIGYGLDEDEFGLPILSRRGFESRVRRLLFRLLKDGRIESNDGGPHGRIWYV